MINAQRIFHSLLPIDLRNIRRDPLLRWVVLAPWLFALLLRVGLPWLTTQIQTHAQFDLRPYHPLILSNFFMLAPSISGMIVGFLLLDERDEGTLTSYAVSPLALRGYLLYRLFLPTFLGFVTTLLSYPLLQAPPIPCFVVIAISAVSALTAPYLALFLAAFASDKVAGLALTKLNNAILMLPVVAYFLPSRIQDFVGMIPVYWPMKAYWQATQGAAWLPYLPLGIFCYAVVIALLLHRFLKRPLP